MSKKQKIQTMMTAALEKTAQEPQSATAQEPESPIPVLAASPPGPSEPWYALVLRKYVVEAEKHQWVAEQIAAAIAWGGENHMVRFPQDALLAMLEDLRGHGTRPAD